MNRFILTGVIRAIKYLPESTLIYVDDMEHGYKRADGVVIDDIFYTWKVVFSKNYKNFIVKFFNEGMLVDIDAKMRPFAIEKDKTVEGYSCLGLSIQRSCYVKASARQEIKMIKESMEHTDEAPNIDSYKELDF